MAKVSVSRETIALGATALATGLAVALLPHEWWPKCPIYSLTGFYCPGCGGLRASWDLLHGNLIGALNQNALIFFIPALITLGLWVDKPQNRRYRKSALIIALSVAALFTVLRNLPGSWMAPDPFGI